MSAGNLNKLTIGDGQGGTIPALYRLDPTASGNSATQMPAPLARTSLSTALAANVATLTVAAGGGRLEVINPDPTNTLYASWDASPTAGAGATGAIPIAANGGAYLADGVQGSLYLWSANATANVTANLWS